MRAVAREPPDDPFLDRAIDHWTFLTGADVFFGQNVSLSQTQRDIVIPGQALVFPIAVHIDIDLSSDDRPVVRDLAVQ